MLNPPSLWITINPCDLHDPIAQVFAGEDINLDDLQEKAGPSKEQCAENMALDPYAASKFFHFLIRTILTTLFGVEPTTQRVHSRMGIFGEVTGYFGLVESQGRGTFHSSPVDVAQEYTYQWGNREVTGHRRFPSANMKLHQAKHTCIHARLRVSRGAEKNPERRGSCIFTAP